MKTIAILFFLMCLTAFGASKKTTDYPPITNAGPNDLLLLSEFAGGVTNSKSISLTNLNNSLLALPSSRITNTQTGVTLDGTFSGNGAGLTSLSSVILSDTGKGTNTTLSQGIIFDFLTFGSGIYFTNTVENLKWTLTSTGTNAFATLGQVSNIVAAATNGLSAGGGSGDTNSFYVLLVATNLLPNSVVVSKITNGDIKIQPQSIYLPTNSSAALDTGSNNVWRLSFDDTVNEQIIFDFDLPEDYGTNLALVCKYSMLTGAATRTNVFSVETHLVSLSVSNNIDVDNWSALIFSTNVIPTMNSVLTNFTFNLGLTTAVAGDTVRIRLQRQATNTMDSASSGDACIRRLNLSYTKR